VSMVHVAQDRNGTLEMHRVVINCIFEAGIVCIETIGVPAEKDHSKGAGRDRHDGRGLAVYSRFVPRKVVVGDQLHVEGTNLCRPLQTRFSLALSEQLEAWS
jgi:hypothetical protein